MYHGVHAHPAPNGADANFCTASYKHLAPNEARAENVSLCRNGIGSLRRRRNVYSHAQKSDPAPVGAVCVMASTHIPLLTGRALIFCTAGYKHLAPNGARAENVSLCRNGIGSLRRRRNVYSPRTKKRPGSGGAGCDMASTHIPLLTERALIFCTARYKHLAPPERGRKTFRCAGMASVRFAGAKCL